MKKIALLICLLPVVCFATKSNDEARISAYQERCAKEQDPVKRQNYCHVFSHMDQDDAIVSEGFQQEVAIA